METKFYSSGEVAKILGVKRKHIVDLILRGTLHAIRVSNRYRISKNDLDTFIRKQRVKPKKKTL